MSSVFTRVECLLQDYIGVDWPGVTMDTTLRRELKLDAEAMEEIADIIDARFGVPIDSSDLRKCITVGDLVNLIIADE